VIARHGIDAEAAKLGKLFHACIEARAEAPCGGRQPARQS
jgi:hypothetical protein